MNTSKEVLNTEISSIELKAGMVVCLKDTKTNTHHNMVIIPLGNNKFGAIEELFGTDEIRTSMLGTNYCELDPECYPDTLGIEPVFGDMLCEIYPHLGWCGDEEHIIITYYDENGVYCSRAC